MSETTIINFGVVVEGKLYRGGQPGIVQFSELKGLGVTDVIDLREPWGREAEASACTSLGLKHYSIPIGFSPLSFGIEPPTNGEISQIMALISVLNRVIFVHCAHGEDRTGAVIAAYRIIYDSWTNAKAFAEAVAYHISPEQIGIRDWIKNYSKHLLG